MNHIRIVKRPEPNALIKQAQRFDRKAQTALYEQYYRAMYNTALRIVQDVHLAEDVMQESFIIAFRKLNQFQGDSTFGAWLKKIVVNQSINHLKKERQLENLHEDAIEEEQSSKDLEFTVEEIKACLPKLAKKFALVFNLYLIEGYDHDEIAEILNISSATSRSQLSRAKIKMKEQLLTSRLRSRAEQEN